MSASHRKRDSREALVRRLRDRSSGGRSSHSGTLDCRSPILDCTPFPRFSIESPQSKTPKILAGNILQRFSDLLQRVASQLSHDIGHIFPGKGFGSLGLVLVPAKKDPNLGKLELRLLFFSSLIFISFEKVLESRFGHKHESRLQSSGETVNFVSNTGSKLLVSQRQIDENLKDVPQRLQFFVI